MTDDNGSAKAGAPDAANGGVDQGSKDTAADPFTGLETGTREWIGTKGYKTVADLAKAAHSAETLIGKSVQIPGADAKPEDILKVFRRLGAPEKPDGYTLTLPEGVADGVLDEAFGAKFRDAAVKAGLTPTQAKAVYDFIATGSADQVKAHTESVAAANAAAIEALTKAWGGPPDSEAFKGASQFFMRAVKGLGGDGLFEALVKKGVLTEPDESGNSAILDDKIAIAFSEIGKRYFTEAGFVNGGGGTVAENPFAAGPGKMNQTTLMSLVAKDRAAAERLAAAAGHKLDDFLSARPAA